MTVSSLSRTRSPAVRTSLLPRRARTRAVVGVLALLTCATAAPSAASQTFTIPVASQATYLRTAPSDAAANTVPIALAGLGLDPGQTLHMTGIGTFDPGPGGDASNSLIGIFSASATLLAPDTLHRVPGAIDAAAPFATAATYFGGLPTDVPQDFRVSGAELPESLVTIPDGATHLFIAIHDSYYEDNSDPNGDYAVRITVVGTWTDVAPSLAGSAGEPHLDGAGLMLGNDEWTLSLADARPQSAAWLLLGFSQLLAPFKGGVMAPFPDVALGPLPTGPAGSIVLSTTWPAGVPSGASVWTQFWIVDAVAPFGYAASNGLRATAP